MSKRLLDEMRDVLRRRHYSIHTERTYCDWVIRYVKTTMIYTHILHQGGQGVASPLDDLV